MSSKGRINLIRAFRVVLAAFLVINVAYGIAVALAGDDHDAAFNFGTVAFLALVMCFQTYVVRRQRRLDRPRPDYSAIARMEGEVYGETFEHDSSNR